MWNWILITGMKGSHQAFCGLMLHVNCCWSCYTGGRFHFGHSCVRSSVKVLWVREKSAKCWTSTTDRGLSLHPAIIQYNAGLFSCCYFGLCWSNCVQVGGGIGSGTSKLKYVITQLIKCVSLTTVTLWHSTCN